MIPDKPLPLTEEEKKKLIKQAKHERKLIDKIKKAMEIKKVHMT